MDQAEALGLVEEFTASCWDVLQAIPVGRGDVHWRRDGVHMVHQRLEALKGTNDALESLWTATQRARALARTWGMRMEHAEDDKTGEGLTLRTAAMVGRGLAADERRVNNQVRAIEIVVWRRRFALAAEEIQAFENAVRARMDRVRSERMDLQTQTRLLQVGLEIGEL